MDDETLNPRPDASQALEPDLQRIVHLLAAELGAADREPVPLDGGITNRNFRTRFGGRDYVVRVPGKDTSLLEIDREAERIANVRAAEAGIAPRVAATLAEPQAIVTVFVEGRGMEAEELRRPAMLTEVARALRTMHELEEPLPTSFSAFRIVETYAETARTRGAGVPDAYAEARGHAAAIEAALVSHEHDPVPCHNDLLAANFILGRAEPGLADQLWIVDWEYAGMGDRYFDLANFTINNELDAGAEHELLTAYFGSPPSAAKLASLGLMRFMSDFREAMWGVLQGAVSELDFDFNGYAAKHFERMALTAADERFDGWLRECAHDAG